MAILLLAVDILAVVLVCRAGKRAEPPEPPCDPEPPELTTIRCPTCGSPAEVRGDTWECGYCGDTGRLR